MKKTAIKIFNSFCEMSAKDGRVAQGLRRLGHV